MQAHSSTCGWNREEEGLEDKDIYPCPGKPFGEEKVCKAFQVINNTTTLLGSTTFLDQLGPGPRNNGFHRLMCFFGSLSQEKTQRYHQTKLPQNLCHPSRVIPRNPPQWAVVSCCWPSWITPPVTISIHISSFNGLPVLALKPRPE